MDAHFLQKLLEKHRQGNCTAEELDALEQWYASLGAGRPERLMEVGSEAANLLTQQKLMELKILVSDERPKVVPFRTKALRWAAVVAGLILMAGGMYYWLKPGSRNEMLAKEHGKPASHVRHITLPDGSLVILHANSRLEYPAFFDKNVREVTLTGEAYFDIRRDTTKPFLIHSGNVRTTVLGTAFNIAAYEHANEVRVSVTRGKVKVETEDSGKLLAVLTPDQQVVYSNVKAVAVKQPVVADTVVLWVGKDMIFENQTFAGVVEMLNSRYHVNIRFENRELEQCLVRASFSGTESLEKVLSVICTIRNASFEMEDENNILISGNGCQQ